MPESRDRLERPLDIDALFARRRTGPVGILRDDVVGLPIGRLPTGRPFGGLAPRRGAGVSGARTPRSLVGRGQSAFRTPAVRTENTPPGGIVIRARGRFGNSVLPSWYPRTPLRDITAVDRWFDITFTDEEMTPDGTGHVRPLYITVKCKDMIVELVLMDNGSALNHSDAIKQIFQASAGKEFILPHAHSITSYPRVNLSVASQAVNRHMSQARERRRSTLRGVEGLEDRVTEGERLPDDLQAGSGVLLEPIVGLTTPSSVKKYKPVSALKMAKTLHKFSTVSAEDPEFLTPQKKLLDSIETVEKILMEDLQRLQRTPSAKRAERVKKVRTLMSMR